MPLSACWLLKTLINGKKKGRDRRREKRKKTRISSFIGIRIDISFSFFICKISFHSWILPFGGGWKILQQWIDILLFCLQPPHAQICHISSSANQMIDTSIMYGNSLSVLLILFKMRIFKIRTFPSITFLWSLHWKAVMLFCGRWISLP